MNDVYYFSHDSNARNDEKILMLRSEYGWEGYGIFWALIEMMFENKDTCLHHNKIKGIAVNYNIDITLLQNVINTLLTEHLFDSDGVIFWSDSLRERKAKMTENLTNKSIAGKKGMEKRWKDHVKKQTDNTVITENNKGKEIKERNKINNKKILEEIFITAQHLTMTEKEYNNLVSEYGKPIVDDKIEYAKNYSKLNKYTSLYLTLNNWLKKDAETAMQKYLKGD